MTTVLQTRPDTREPFPRPVMPKPLSLDVLLCALMLDRNRLPADGGLAVGGEVFGHGWARHKRSY